MNPSPSQSRSNRDRVQTLSSESAQSNLVNSIPTTQEKKQPELPTQKVQVSVDKILDIYKGQVMANTAEADSTNREYKMFLGKLENPFEHFHGQFQIVETTNGFTGEQTHKLIMGFFIVDSSSMTESSTINLQMTKFCEATQNQEGCNQVASQNRESCLVQVRVVHENEGMIIFMDMLVFGMQVRFTATSPSQ
eukprot:TRINITY_DN10621_c0_g1_i1.p1 TRINITY_DN10621_c0_g1~~TRINITY_DN10621_c0_g1_i1.p1  ORF type:complete len:193 (+),score=48.82 TRINITY_DN10621_c0_g1_i1:575-1153(+)